MKSSSSLEPPAAWLTPIFAVVSLILPTAARAAIQCNDPSIVNPVYGIGGSGQTPLVGAIATILANQTPPVTVVYSSVSACNGISTLLSATDTFTSSATYWSPDGGTNTCTPPPTGTAADFAIMGVYADSCSGYSSSELPDAGIDDFVGPVLAWNLIVPTASSQTSISAEAAYVVFGFGAAAGSPAATPWTLPSEIIIRSATSAAQIAVATAVGIPPSAVQGTPANPSSNTGTIENVSQAVTPESAIGFVSSDVADASRKSVNTLAYQHFQQSCGYSADSTSTAFDKANVRSGQYFLWSNSHLFTFTDSSGTPVVNPTGTGNPSAVAKILSYFQPTTAQQLQTVISTGNIPVCAMNATRATDLGPIQSFQPQAACDGFFEFTAAGSTKHPTCTTNSDCSVTPSAPVCHFGYCEVQ